MIITGFPPVSPCPMFSSGMGNEHVVLESRKRSRHDQSTNGQTIEESFSSKIGAGGPDSHEPSADVAQNI